MERNRHENMVACFCEHCSATTPGFQMVTSRVRDYHQTRTLRNARDIISHNVNATVVNLQQESSSLSDDGMDIDYNMPSPSSHGTASDYQRAPLSPEDNVFATDDIDVGNGEENDDEVIMNAEDIEFGDNDLGNENGMINIDQGFLVD
ncbi:hypothetical protein INT45_013876 [Circinella minor]|uniref:Uncharacterized protein n=1 Tax=Circinella minor TaxID=1195481 RepID=A0A8H7RFM9_9FUNG|nr:hypothetical protein INT45_013876 [Circinella minor]